MNNVQKTLLSVVAICSFGYYAYVQRTQNDQIVATADTSTDQQSLGTSVAAANAEFQAYANRINAAAQDQSSRSSGSIAPIARGDDYEREGDDESPRIIAQSTAPAPKPTQTPTPQKPAAVQIAPQATPPQIGQYRNGTYTGSSVDVFYGFVQVQAVVQNGRLASVSFLSYPNDRDTSRQINTQAMPILTREAIQAQSARVSGVSGASDTSAGFVQSLGEALAQAHV